MLTEVYKTTRGKNPIFMSKIFTQKKAILQPVDN